MAKEGTSGGVAWGDGGGVPSALLRDIVAHFRPLEVILFGSARRDERGVDSDFDIAVILPDDAPAQLLHWRAANEARRGHAIAVDIVPFRRSAFAAAADEVGSLPWVIAREGRVVWRREAATVDG
jgi:uncharacterized protein